MKIVFIQWGPAAPHYYIIAAEDKTLRSKGQLGSFNTDKTVLAPDWYQAFNELPAAVKQEVQQQADQSVAEYVALRALAERLTS